MGFRSFDISPQESSVAEKEKKKKTVKKETEIGNNTIMNVTNQKKLYIVDVMFIVVAGLLFGLFRPDSVVIAVYFLLFPYMYFTKRKALLVYLGVSSLLAMVWVVIAQEYYGYNIAFLNIFGVTVFPFFAWATGLFGLWVLFGSVLQHKQEESFYKRFVMCSLVYSIVLISVEYIAYHHLRIQNVATSEYPGLPFCDCWHAPVWMQWSYIGLGLMFFALSLRIEAYKHKKVVVKKKRRKKKV